MPPAVESDFINEGRQPNAIERGSDHLYQRPEQRGDGYRTTDGGYMKGASTPNSLPNLEIVMNDRAPSPRGQQAERQTEATQRRAEATKPNEQWAFNEGQYGQAIQKAAADGKPVVIKVGTDWCGPCNRMKAETLTDAGVQKNMKDNAVFLDVNAERAEALAQSLGVNSYPTTIIAAVEKNQQGQLQLKKVTEASGYMDANTFNGFLNKGLPAADRVMDANGFTGPKPTERPAERTEATDTTKPTEKGPERRVDRRNDGSAVEYTKFADGAERPTGVGFPNGTGITYEYDAKGRVVETRDFDAKGHETMHYQTRDGVNWSEAQGRAANIQGSLKVTPDGSHVFKDSVLGNTFIRKPDGSVSLLDNTGAVKFSSPAMQQRRQ
jgi:YD repeat-containing protein